MIGKGPQPSINLIGPVGPIVSRIHGVGGIHEVHRKGGAAGAGVGAVIRYCDTYHRGRAAADGAADVGDITTVGMGARQHGDGIGVGV